ncbi:MAG: AAA family ATPase [Burkholderiaceae bacterium]
MTFATRVADPVMSRSNGVGLEGQAIYLDHFGLKRQPFRLTPGIDCFYEGAERGRILTAMAYALVHGDGIIMLTGEIGSGKSTLAGVLMARASSRIKFIYVANPSLEPRELLEVMADELSLGHLADSPNTTLTRHIQKRLIALHAGGRQVVMLVDEAQAMPVSTLQQLRLMSNLETSVQKLLQVVLVGQPELDDVLAQPQLRPLRERIAHSFRVKPLTEADIRRYLTYRIRQAGGDPGIFDGAAASAVSRNAKGIARRVNLIADKCLLSAYMDGSNHVNRDHVREALADVAFQFDIDPSEFQTRQRGIFPNALLNWFVPARS